MWVVSARRLGKLLLYQTQVYSTIAQEVSDENSEGFGFTSEDLSNAKPYEEIPMPKSYPYVGNLFSFKPFGELDVFDRYQCCTKMHERYGDIARITLPFLPEFKDMVQIMDPDDFEIIYRNESKLPERAVDPVMKKYKESRKQGLGLFVSNGEEWWKFRQPLNKGMMKANAATPYLAAQDPVGDELVQNLKKSLNSDNAHPMIMEDIFRYALESICTIVFDRRLGCMDPNLAPNSWQQEFINSVHTAIRRLTSLNINPIYKLHEKIGYESSAYREYIKCMDYISDTSLRLILEAKEEWADVPEVELQKKFLPQLFNVGTLDVNDKLSLIFDMMLAAIDTTTYTTLRCCFFLAKNPEVQEKLYAEINENVTDLQSVKFSKLPYLRACIKENNRMKPIVPVNNRQLSCDIVVKGYLLPKGVQVFLEHEYVCNSPRYVKNPEIFNPDRWIRGAVPEDEKLPPFSMLPFGFGPRMCIGKRFAEQELNIALIKLVKNFRLEYDGDELPLKGIGVDKLPMKLNFKFHERS